MRIAILVEGRTERAFARHLRCFLESRLPGQMPRLDFVPYDGRIPKGEKLRRTIDILLNDGPRAADAVIALTDVYTGTREFADAAEARKKMRDWVGSEERFFPHAAQYDFEAWLIPYWGEIQRLAGHNRNSPGAKPELINHDTPPAHHIQAIFRDGSKGKAYVKPRDASRILEGQDLLVAVQACPEFKALLNTILQLSGGAQIF